MTAHQKTLLAIALSLLSAALFTTTYVLNRAVALQGGHWAWTASLRYLFMLPLLLPLMPWQGGVAPVLRALRAAPLVWLGWSLCGFVLFYALLSFAASSGPGWLVAGSFQLMVVTGMLCAPLLYDDARARIPRAGLMIGLVIVAGVLLMQFGHAQGAPDANGWIALLCVVIAAFAYPVGNRGLLVYLEKNKIALNATQRVLGLTLASYPVWLAMALWAWQQAGPPPAEQIEMTLIVALVAGVAATVLFFQATGMVRDNATALGAVEAMQASEVIIAMVLGTLFFGERWPSGMALAGALLVVAGIALFAWMVARKAAHDPREVKAQRSERTT
ncbi:MAG: multidrug resistance efflux transporter family protein [Thermomonas sp.]|uniref:multidrug resistance efflux transporter family protein n=1 Tax=Thermomonas sp. TaxID=1971895 RepID=UPI001EC84202|nr:multidrug resistance efflux transporter family protein [Thermomonas sp.]MBV2209128.1 multidrug resistance efflux transporter family protein [Thermomonas sp.]